MPEMMRSAFRKDCKQWCISSWLGNKIGVYSTTDKLSNIEQINLENKIKLLEKETKE
jgi:hypothetical protein